MRPKDIVELLRRLPFEPFPIHLSDGVAFDVRHPGMAIVQRSKVIVTVPGPEGSDGPPESRRAGINCALIHITRTEVVNGATARG